MLNQVYATKVAMTQAFAEGKRIPLTVLTVDPHTVIRTKTEEKDGYSSVVFGLGSKTKKGVTTNKKLKEIFSADTLENGTVVNLSEILVAGSTISVTSVSKGKGFTGVMKRWGFAGGPRTHGQSDRGRAPGSIGRGTTPGRVLPGTHMAGRMGNASVCIRNLSIFSFDPETNILKVTGAIPGGRGALAKVTITKLAENK
jgi:large subunit ribosomal protein L3